jgi:hypothetical protein
MRLSDLEKIMAADRQERDRVAQAEKEAQALLDQARTQVLRKLPAGRKGASRRIFFVQPFTAKLHLPWRIWPQEDNPSGPSSPREVLRATPVWYIFNNISFWVISQMREAECNELLKPWQYWPLSP